MFKKLKRKLVELAPTNVAKAHCDGPCGVYDPSSTRIPAEAVLSMTKKILALESPEDGDDAKAMAQCKIHLRVLSRSKKSRLKLLKMKR